MTTPTAHDIARLALFAGLSAEEHQRLAEMARVEVFPAGAVVFKEGDPPGALYLLLDGRVTLCMRISGQPETCILSLRHGELLGWSSLLNRRRVATARAVTSSKLVAFDASELLELCEQDSNVGYRVMRQAFEELADRLSDTRLQLIDMFGQPRA